jgi:hypothetical protein
LPANCANWLVTGSQLALSTSGGGNGVTKGEHGSFGQVGADTDGPQAHIALDRLGEAKPGSLATSRSSFMRASVFSEVPSSVAKARRRESISPEALMEETPNKARGAETARDMRSPGALQRIAQSTKALF